MAKKKTVKTMELEAPVLKNSAIIDNPSDEKRQALIKFDELNVLRINYDLQDESGDLTNVVDGKSSGFNLGVDLGYIPTLTVKFIIENSLHNESDLALLRNVSRLVNRDPVATFEIVPSPDAVVITPGQTGEFILDKILFRKVTSSDNYLAWAGWENLSGLTAEYSDMVNCTKASSASSNLNITDPTKDASITVKLSA